MSSNQSKQSNFWSNILSESTETEGMPRQSNLWSRDLTDTEGITLPEPHSFPKPGPGAFLEPWSPYEPETLLPNTIRVQGTQDGVINKTNAYLDGVSTYVNRSGSSWVGEFTSENGTSGYRICCYKSRRADGEFVFEPQRTNNGDGFAYGDLWNGLRDSLR